MPRSADLASWLGVLWANAGRAPPHAIRPSSTTPTPQQVGGTTFERPLSPYSNPAAGGQRAFRPVEYRPATQRACTSVNLAWLCCGPMRGALLATRRPRLDHSNTAAGW